MKVLILGAGGMLGHKLWQTYRDKYEVWGTVRSSYHRYAPLNLFDPKRLLEGVDATNLDTVISALGATTPDVVINCIGILKQLPTAKDPIVSLSINSLFPHRLANLCQSARARLIHISTDCVFSGRKGMYAEDDASDAEDLYGRTKYLGEVSGLGCLTLRTSIIGRELATASGLVEWFLGNQGSKVRGYTQAIYSGFSTLALARIIADVLENHPGLTGLYHVSSDPISKYDLLCLIRRAVNLPIEIEPFEEIRIDRSLDSTRFRQATGFTPPSWPEMVTRMIDDFAPYEQWRNST